MLLSATEAVQEIENDKPRTAPSLLSREEKDRLIQRGFLGLYRWYVERSQSLRNWSPDRSFDWREFRQDHSAEILTIIEGFYAIEQFAPDYTTEIVRLVRTNYGRAQFQLRWGAEEEKHSDLWRNTLLFSRKRSADWVEQYTSDLRQKSYELPFDDGIRMIIYTVIQERATQLNYLNMAKIARGESDKPCFANDVDPVLARVAQTIAIDEAAHYNFFLEGARLYLYYYPRETLEALIDVLQNFAMPGPKIVYNHDEFVKAVYDADIFNKRKYYRDVVKAAVANLGISSIKAVEHGIRASRTVPDENGTMRDTAVFDTVDFKVVESAVARIFSKVGDYEAEIGFDEVDPIEFRANIWA